jgi:phosphatidylglycerophosphatase A
VNTPRTPEILIGSAFGIGFVPFAPGTVASAAVVPVAFGFWLWMGALGLWVLLATCIGACIWSADPFETAYGKDPACFVMDEWAGQTVPFAMLSLWTDPFVPEVAIACFILFRIFDIWKPGPIGTIQNRPGVIGLAGDDILAGLVSTVAGFVVIFV